MKKILFNFLTWIYVQFYVAFAILFLSKTKLMQIAFSGGNHPLVIMGTARWMRVWWFSLLGLGIWVFAFFPFINMSFGHLKTFGIEFTFEDKVIIFGKYSVDLWIYWMVGIFSGKLLQLLEIWSCNKMDNFRRFMNYRKPSVPNHSKLTQPTKKLPEATCL